MRGFTLIELLLVIAIITIIAAMSVPFMQNTQVTADLDSQTQSLLGLVRAAQWQSMSGQDASGWGVYFNSESKEAVLYRGGEFTTRDSSFDYVLNYSDNLTLNTDFGNEVFFGINSFVPSASGTINILSDGTSDSRQILINGYGKIELEK